MVDAPTSVASIMSRDVQWLEPDAPLDAALEAMASAQISCVVVCEREQPVGIVTERDVVLLARELLTGSGARVRSVRELMTAPVHSVPEHESLEAALMLAQQQGVRHLLVVDARGKLAGIVTQTDLMHAFEAARRHAEELSLHDGLLGIRNRRSMEQDLVRMHARYLRYRRPYSLVMCDLDGFKAYNDRYGHQAGDDVLRRVAANISEIMRKSDCAYRYGGEEILVTLDETEGEAARQAAERMRAQVEALAIRHEESPHGVVTISCGVASGPAHDLLVPDWHALVRAADEALYRAKNAGRNRVEL